MRNLPHGFDIYLVNVKTIRQIAQIFVAFSEKLNFTIILSLEICRGNFVFPLYHRMKVQQKICRSLRELQF